MKLVNLRTLSADTSLSVYMICLYCKKHGLPHYKIGRKILVNPDEFSSWLRKINEKRSAPVQSLAQLLNSTFEEIGL